MQPSKIGRHPRPTSITSGVASKGKRLAVKRCFRVTIWGLLAGWAAASVQQLGAEAILPANHGTPFVQRFNAADDQYVINAVPNDKAASWIASCAPRFDCPATRFVETYYYRWWTFRKHIKQTPDGRVLTEFITPVSHAGTHNTIACAMGHHLAEGRWLHDRRLLDEYVHFWLRRGPQGGPQPHLHRFSSWLASAMNDRRYVTGDDAFALDLLDDLVADYRVWQAERQLPSGLFWQHDVKDGMEESISGGRRVKNVRPTINAYMIANARAIAELAGDAERYDLAEEFHALADELYAKFAPAMWDDDAGFYKVRLESGELSDARESIGYIPWLYGIATPEQAVAWSQTQDRHGFWAPAGLTTAERRHPAFRSHGTGTCEWDGAVWPFATSQTLGAMANVLRGPPQPYVTRSDYFDHLLRYANAHQQQGAAYLGEYLDEVTGKWLITGPKERRSRYYNHSTFCDLVITGLVGVTPQNNDTLVVAPLLLEDAWDFFCLDGLPYRGREITILWDRTGDRYQRGAGLRIFVDGTVAAQTEQLTTLSVDLNTVSTTP